MREVTISRGNEVLFLRARRADSFWSRLVGLMMTPRLEPDQALIISRCQAVHTFFMSFPIDVIYLDRTNRVVTTETLVPWRLGRFVYKAASVIECPVGTIAKHAVSVDDAITLTGYETLEK